MSYFPTSDELVETMQEFGGPVSSNDLMKIHHVNKSDRADMRRALKDLERQGRIEKLRGKFWQIKKNAPKLLLVRGLLMISRKGTGFVRPHSPLPTSGKDSDIMVEQNQIGDAMDGDIVEVECWLRPNSGWRGKINNVVKRARTVVVGQFQQVNQRSGWVIPRNPSIGRKISVPLPDESLKVKQFDWVEAEITQYTPTPLNLKGKVKSLIGGSHEKGIDVLLLIRDRGFSEEFPPYVEEAVAKLELDVEKEIPNRLDLRKLPTATIDPVTAKDFDDALSIEPIYSDKSKKQIQAWKLFVHIADVTHYVTHEDLIDQEARERSTSVYPVDRVVPMLPEKLCNDLCSLKPNVDRLAVTTEMIVARNGDVSNEKFHASIIHSDRRFAYEEVQAFIENEKPDLEAPPEILDSIGHLRDCAKALRSKRFKRGALDLDIPKPKFVLDEDGKLKGFEQEKRFEAHRIVEDCMLAANEAVARFLEKNRVPTLYRVHEVAEPERLFKLARVFHELGITVPISKKGEMTPFDLQKAIDLLEKKPAGHILRRIMLRCMKRAEYSPENQGHFGLASESYCHFTSPIRRYPDVVVHRQLKSYVRKDKKLPFGNPGLGIDDSMRELGSHTSRRERMAADAEYDSMKIKMIESFEQQVGDEFEGYISGTNHVGLFVELVGSGLEGFVHARTLQGDRFDEDEFQIAMVGQKTGRRYQITDKIKVRLIKADPMELKIDFEVVDEENQPKKSGTSFGKKKKLRGIPKPGQKRRNKRR